MSKLTLRSLILVLVFYMNSQLPEIGARMSDDMMIPKRPLNEPQAHVHLVSKTFSLVACSLHTYRYLMYTSHRLGRHIGYLYISILLHKCINYSMKSMKRFHEIGLIHRNVTGCGTMKLNVQASVMRALLAHIFENRQSRKSSLMGGQKMGIFIK